MSASATPKIDLQKHYPLYRDASSTLLALYAGVIIWLVFLIGSDQFFHWFIIPLLACVAIIGGDAVNWLRGRTDLFDPIGIIGMLGFHFFFLAPLLHVHWDFWLLHVVHPEEWRTWLGLMAALNALGLLVYYVSRQAFDMRSPLSTQQPPRFVWLLNTRQFYIFGIVAMAVTCAAQGLVYASYGGISGYISAYEERTLSDSAFRGMGWVFMISESFPILALIVLAVYIKDKDTPFFRSWTFLILVLILFFILKLLFGGLRGSRSNTVWGLFWAAGIIHFWIRPITKQIIMGGLVFLVLFLYIYGFYKGGGIEGLQAVTDEEVRVEMSENQNRDLEATFLNDLGRSDIQAFLLYRMVSPESDYEYAFGRTYIGDVSILIPRMVWNEMLGIDRPVNKIKEGTDAMYGMGTFIPGQRVSSRIYGLAGEMMLNFGPLLVPFAFISLGLLVGWLRQCLTTWHPLDVRWLLFPALVNLAFVVLAGDMDNIVFFSIKNLCVPVVVLLVGSVQVRQDAVMQP